MSCDFGLAIWNFMGVQVDIFKSNFRKVNCNFLLEPSLYIYLMGKFIVWNIAILFRNYAKFPLLKVMVVPPVLPLYYDSVQENYFILNVEMYNTTISNQEIESPL